jgi:hypothetical protein
MAPAVTFEPVTLATQSMDDQGRLVLVTRRLAGVLVFLRDEVHGEHCGSWFLEAAFGDFADGAHVVFQSLDAAAQWFGARQPNLPAQ